MRRAALATAALFATTALHLRTADGNLWWNTANAFGFLACALMMMLALLGGRAPPTGAGLSFHRHLGWAALAIVGLHIAMTLPDAAVFEYLSIGAPAYMWAGLAALVPLALLTFSGLQGPRRRWFASAADFRRAHLLWTLVTAALVCWHVIGSGYYVKGVAAAILFVIVFMGVPIYAQLHRSTLPAAPYRRWPYIIGGVFLAAFVAGRISG